MLDKYNELIKELAQTGSPPTDFKQQTTSLDPEQFWLDKIKQSKTAEELRITIAPEIKTDTRLSSLSRELITREFANRLIAFTGTKVPIGAIRTLLKQEKGAYSAEEDDRPDWLTSWVYVQDRDEFMHKSSKIGLSTKAFDLTFARFTKHLEGDLAGISATKAATFVWPCEIAISAIYWPLTDQPYFRFPYTGEPMFNLYNPRSVPEVPDELTASDLQAQQWIDEHFIWLIADPDERKALKNWCAWQVKYPGRKIRWAPLICGLQGDGKTIIGEVLQSAMGYRNVQIVGNNTITGSIFTEWGHGYALNVLEEINTPGHNRHEVVNKLKSFISNDRIEVHPKGRKPFNVPNTTNYLLLTNYEDSIPLEDTDRRYFPLRTRYRTKRELELALLKDPGHFAKIVEAKENHPGALRKYFLDYQISDDFNPNLLPGETAYKRTMIELNRSDEDDLLGDLIADGTVPGINWMMVSIKEFGKELRKNDLPVLGRQISKTLTKAGFVSLSTILPNNRISINGEQHRIWIRPEIAEQQENIKEWIKEVIIRQSDLNPVLPPEEEDESDDIFNDDEEVPF